MHMEQTNRVTTLPKFLEGNSRGILSSLFFESDQRKKGTTSVNGTGRQFLHRSALVGSCMRHALSKPLHLGFAFDAEGFTSQASIRETCVPQIAQLSAPMQGLLSPEMLWTCEQVHI